jgi:hypothetical protein
MAQRKALRDYEQRRMSLGDIVRIINAFPSPPPTWRQRLWRFIVTEKLNGGSGNENQP